jgi:hypothetical protein
LPLPWLETNGREGIGCGACGIAAGQALPRLPHLGFSATFGYSTATEESVPTVRSKGKAKARKNHMKQSRFDFTKVDAAPIPTVILVGHPSLKPVFEEMERCSPGAHHRGAL